MIDRSQFLPHSERVRIKISEKQKFVLRVAGIFLRDGHVLLHRAEHEDIWALPGGGCDFSEDTKAALIREAEEELSAAIEVKSLAFVVENFFEWSGDEAHEIGFYYLAEFKGSSLQFYDKSEFTGVETKMEGFDKFRLFFKWFPVDSLGSLNLKPDFLKTEIPTVGESVRHIVQRNS